MPVISEIYPFANDAERFRRVLAMLARHLDERVTVTGSFAVEWQLLRRGVATRGRRLNDIDTVLAKVTGGIGAGIAEDFLINHFHPTREKGNVFIQLVEPETATRVDIFSARSPSVPERASRTQLGDTDAAVVAIEDLMARLLAIIDIVIENKTIDPKYVRSFTRLLEVGDSIEAAALWSEYKRSGDLPDLGQTWNDVQRKLAENPDLLKPETYSHDVDAVCPWCVDSEAFPVADRSRIFEVLGYV
ncbi:MAG: hypothetical protein ABI999_15030 [Acidobacteriota bacterium]